jgi:hypothetical protein
MKLEYFIRKKSTFLSKFTDLWLVKVFFKSNFWFVFRNLAFIAKESYNKHALNLLLYEMIINKNLKIDFSNI